VHEPASPLDKEPPEGGRLYLTQIAPRLEKGMSSADIAKELRMEPKEVEGLIATWTTPICVQDGPQLFEDIKAGIREHFYFEEEWHYTIAALYVLECAVFKSLPVVFYLYFPGTFGTGKTNILGLIATLTESVSLENVSVAALAHELGDGRSVCIDEYDVPRGKDIDEVRNALVRQGYKRNAAPYTRHDPVKKKNEHVSVFSPKALTFRGSIEQALQSRGYTIPTVKVRGKDGYRYVLNNLYPHIQELPYRIAEWGRMAAATFPDSNLEAMARSPELEDEVKVVCNELGANRSAELATVAILVAHMAGLDIVADLRKANELNELETAASETEDREDLLEALRDLTNLQMRQKGELVLEEAKIVRHRQREVLECLNRLREERHEKPLNGKAFAALRRDAGIREEWLAFHGHAKYWNLPMEWVKETLLATPAEIVKEGPAPESAPFVLPIFYHGKELVVKNAAGEVIPARRLHDEIAWRVRNHPDVPAAFVRTEIALALQLPEDSREIVEGYIEALRAMQTWPELPGGSP